MALVAVSGPVTSVEIVMLASPRLGILLPHTGFQAIDGLVASLGFVSLGHDRGNPTKSAVVPESKYAGRHKRAACFANSRHDCRGERMIRGNWSESCRQVRTW